MGEMWYITYASLSTFHLQEVQSTPEAIVKDFPLDIHKQSQYAMINHDLFVASRVCRAIVECHIHPVLQNGLNANLGKADTQSRWEIYLGMNVFQFTDQ
jgi:hypothetical protein